MSGISDGQDADASHFNAAFLAKNGDDTTTGKINLHEASSANVDDLQGVINTILTDITTIDSNISSDEARLTVIEGQIGSETTSAIGNTQTGANVSGLTLSTSHKLYLVDYWVRRIATSTVMEVGRLSVWYDGTTWYVARVWYSGNAGIDFDIDSSTGQVTYTTDTMSGTYDSVNSLMGWRPQRMG